MNRFQHKANGTDKKKKNNRNYDGGMVLLETVDVEFK